MQVQAARISFQDEMSTRGELDLGDLVPGDVVRLENGDLAEVVEAMPTDPSILVTAPTSIHDAAERQEVVLSADDIKAATLMVDSRDPRIGNSRIVAIASSDLDSYGC